MNGTKKKTILWGLPLIVLVAIAGTFLYLREHRYGLPEGTSMPEFTLRDPWSQTFDSASLWGKVAVIVFWRPSADASVAEIKGLDLLWRKYRVRGLEVVGISLDEGGGRYLKSFIARHKVGIPLLAGDVETAHLFGGLRGIPTTFIFDRDGKVREVIEGFQDEDTLERKIVPLL
jgi:peroxiredoxin